MSNANSWPPDRSFWIEEFPARTNNRTTPYLFKGIIPATAADADAVLDGFSAIRRAHAEETPISAHARVYVGEHRRDDLLGAVLTAPDRAGGGFVEWMQELVGADRFSLVINNLETVSPKLAAGLGTFLASLMSGWGVPMGGAELVAFAGNYSGTAFGVHEGYEDAFLTHYGPGSKHFYTWSGEDYRKLTGGDQPLYGDYQWLLEHGEHWILEPGDALFLPRRVFHVGRQDEFSVSVAVPVYTYPDAAILSKAVLPELLETLLAGDPDSALGQPSPMAALDAGHTPAVHRLADLADQALTGAARQAGAVIEQHMRQRWNTILSNGGWEMVTDDLARTQAATAFAAGHVGEGAEVAVIEPYRLIAAEGKAFLRGYEVSVDATVLTAELVAAVNSGPITLPDDQDLLRSVRALGTTGGLAVTARPAVKEEASA
ncbi:JmjC domain-containing protein [Micromonospora aurantiaca (nom. illeg.)]|uniref:JmjC domain-containing protein n=1 Tax=Micromonospora aurantiaca (nom. illeg.) TaxID=47850 RepID=UPI0033E96EE8